MFVNIGLDPDRVSLTDVPTGELLIVDGNDHFGRFWQALDVQEAGSRSTTIWLPF